MMKPIDPQADARVWARVRGCETPKKPCYAELIRDKAHAAAVYGRMAVCFPCYAQRFRRFAAEEAHDLCLLQTMQYARTGECPKTPSVQTPALSCLCDALRTAILREQQLAEKLDAQVGPFGGTCAEMASRDRAHADALLELLTRCVCR